MSTEPIAATIEEIEAKFPSMKPERILACIKRKMPMASVMTEALGAMEEELMAVKAKLAEYEQKEMAAKAEMEISVEEEPKEEEMMAKAKAKAGVKPVAKPTGSAKPSAKAQWDSLIEEKVKTGLSRPKAVMAVVRSHPEIRQQMLAEVNS